jgi:predicted neuraminidase
VKVADSEALPHWNPVLFLAPDGTVYLYYKVGKSIPDWQTWFITSADGGQTWSSPQELVPGDRGGRGPVKNKPIVASNGTWLAPASREGVYWDCFVDISMDSGRSWQSSKPVPVEHATFSGRGVIQPTLWESEPGKVHMLMRSTCGFVCRSDSTDYGLTWSPVYPTTLLNNNSGIDLVQLPGGNLILAHNPVGQNWGPRTPLVLSISQDNGFSWETLLTMEHEGASQSAGASTGVSGVHTGSSAEFSYPSVIPSGSGVALAYTWKRKRIAFVEMVTSARANLIKTEGTYFGTDLL